MRSPLDVEETVPDPRVGVGVRVGIHRSRLLIRIRRGLGLEEPCP